MARHKNPAIAGGSPVRTTMLPYGRHDVGRREERAVVDVVRNGWLTMGPRVREFEASFREKTGAPYAVAVATGTSALHLALLGLEIGPGDEVITSPLTFVATANAIVQTGARPVFADIDATTLNLDPAAAARKVTKRTRAVIPVHYGGAPGDLDAFWKLGRSRGLTILEDACHAVGSSYHDRQICAAGDAQCFSFHPVKTMTTAEGAMVTTRSRTLDARLRALRFHGFVEDSVSRKGRGASAYPRMQMLGTKSVISDLQAALGLVQLRRLEEFTKRRNRLAKRYTAAFSEVAEIVAPSTLPETTSAWHIYVIRLDLTALRCSRDEFMDALRAENIGTAVHYLPVHLQPYYRRRFGTRSGLCPVAERAYRHMVTIPLFPKMTDRDQDDVIEGVHRLLDYYRR
jgi:dTDP-4-amino-4,6-dideoxygalactose transaminase